jgi:hypothetical protein
VEGRRGVRRPGEADARRREGNDAVGRARREGGRERERTARLGLGGPAEGEGGCGLWAGIWLP